MQQIILATMLAILLSISGCADIFAAKTVARYKVIKPDGTTIEAEYESGKQQEGFRATLPEGVKIQTDKSSTQEAATEAALAIHLQTLRLLESLSGRVPVAPLKP